MNNGKAPEFIPVCKGFVDKEIRLELSGSNRPFIPPLRGVIWKSIGAREYCLNSRAGFFYCSSRQTSQRRNGRFFVKPGERRWGKVLERKENGSKRSFPFRCFETKMVYE